jgi:hypothetical protein
MQARFRFAVCPAAPSQFPPLKWAQRSQSLYVTIDVPNLTSVVVQAKENQVVFRFVCADLSTRLSNLPPGPTL